MADTSADLIDGADLESPNLNPAFSLDPTFSIRAVPLSTQQVFPETSSQLLAPLSTTYTPPGTRVASLAPEPGATVDLAPKGVNVAPPQIAPVIPAGSEAPQVQTTQVAQAGQAAPYPQAPQPPARPQVQRNSPFLDTSAPQKTGNPLQDQMNEIDKQISRAHQTGYGAISKVLQAETAEKARAEEVELLKKKEDIQKQIQEQVSNQQYTRNMGLWNAMPADAGHEATNEEGIEEMRKGNFGAYQGLIGAGLKARADMYIPDMINGLSKDVDGAAKIFQGLEKAKTQTDYANLRAKAIKEAAGKPNNYALFGMTENQIPLSLDDFKAHRGALLGKLNNTKQFVLDYEQKQREQGQAISITNPEIAKSVTERRKMANGEVIPNGSAVTLPQLGNAQAVEHQPNSRDLNKYGPGDGPDRWNNMNETKQKVFNEQLGAEEVKGALSQHKMALDFLEDTKNDAMYTSAMGIAKISDSSGGVFRDVAEKSQAAGTVGVSKMLDQKYGSVDNALNTMYTNWSAYKAYIQSGGKGEPVKLEPRLTPEAIRGIKEVAQFHYDQMEKKLARVAGPAYMLGLNGGDLEKSGLDPTAQEAVRKYHQQGLEAGRLSYDQYPSYFNGNTRYSLNPGATGPDVVPAGTYAKELADRIHNTLGAGGSSPVAPAAPGAFPTGGTSPVPGLTVAPAAGGGVARPMSAPAAPAAAGGALRPMVATPATSLIQSLGGAAAAPAAPVQTAQAQLPSAWGVGAQPSTGTFMPSARPAAAAPPAAPAAAAAPAATATPTAAPLPAYLRNNPTASTVYTTSQQTATNLSGGNVVVGNNVAKIATSSAASESNFKPHELHDKDQTTGEYAGYGLYGHQKDRLARMQTSAGNPAVGKPDAAISPEAQTAFYTREIVEAAKTDPFIRKVLNDPNASAEDLTRVQMRMEQPKGYVKGQEEKGHNWAGRLASTQAMLQGSGQQSTGETVGSPGSAATAEANYWKGQSGLMRKIPENAPAIGATLGGAVTAPYGPVAQAVGAEAGGVLGGAAKNAMIGDDQSWTGYGKAMAAGGFEALPMAIPGQGYKALAGRALTSGGVEGAKELIESGDIPKALNAAGASTLSAAGSETFMLALGKGFSGIYKMATTPNKVALENAGRVLSEEKPKTMLADGSTVENKNYTIAKKFADDKNIDPDHLAHAYEQTQKMANRGEALTSRPAEVELRRAGQQLEDIKNKVGNVGAASGALPATIPAGARIKDGPISSINTGPASAGKIDARYLPEATQAESLLQKQAPSMGHWWENAAQARTELLQHERDAIAASNTHRADAMRDIANTVRLQQEKTARRLLPPDQADALINNLRATDNRYRKAVLAGGDDIVKTIAAGGAKANQARTAFDALAGHDQDAKNMMRALTTAEGRATKSVAFSIALTASGMMSAVPVVGPAVAAAGTVISAVKLAQMTKDYMVQKGAGKLVTMKELVGQEINKTRTVMRQGGATIGGSLGANAAHSLAYPEPASP